MSRRWEHLKKRPGLREFNRNDPIFGSQAGLMVVALVTETYTPLNKDRPSGQHSIRLLY